MTKEERKKFVHDNGGYWSSVGHPDNPVDDWKYEIANDGTRLGYWDWVLDRIKFEK